MTTPRRRPSKARAQLTAKPSTEEEVTEAIPEPSPEPGSGPENCVLCGDPVPEPKENARSGFTADYRACPDVLGCLDRAVERSPTRRKDGPAPITPSPFGRHWQSLQFWSQAEREAMSLPPEEGEVSPDLVWDWSLQAHDHTERLREAGVSMAAYSGAMVTDAPAVLGADTADAFPLASVPEAEVLESLPEMTP